MKIYISIPITGHDIEEQRMKADLIQQAYTAKGDEVVNPFEIYAGKDADYFDHISYDIRALADCDAIYLCCGWQYSKGCRLEKSFSEIYGKRIMYECEEYPDNYWR